MSNPSRFDRPELLSANGGYFFRNECLMPNTNIMRCEVRLKEDKEPLLPNTKCVMLLGKDATDLWTRGATTLNTLGEIRGSIYNINGVPYIPSYLPQDCMDFKDHESSHNILLQGKDYDEAPSSAAKSSLADKRRHGVTARINWKFWLKKDTEKAMRLVNNNGIVPPPPFAPDYKIYPSLEEAVQLLTTVKNNNLYIDIETDENFHIKCIGFSFDGYPVYVCPLLTWQYEQAYDGLPYLLRAFTLAIKDNTIVSHNGHQFDWIVLPWKYGIPLGHKFYDTMLVQQRIYPDVEKSLGHATSLWTYEPFHKDQGGTGYSTPQQAADTWAYCGKDVYTMKLIKHAMDKFILRVPGLDKSVEQVNSSIRAYITMTLMGQHYKVEMLNSIMRENDRLMMQYLRCIRLLIGEDLAKALMKKSKKGMPGSNTQCVAYFHDIMGYPVVNYGNVRKDGYRHPSLAKQAMYTLRLRHNNPVIDFVLAYRTLSKESGSLKFIPWLTEQTGETNNASSV